MPLSIPIGLLADERVRAQANRVLHLLTEFFPINTLFIALNDGQTNHILASLNRSQPLVMPDQDLPLSEAYCRLVVESQDFTQVSDTATDPRTQAMGVTQKTGSTMFIGLPVKMHDGTVIGTLCGMDTHPFVLSPRDQALLESMAELFGLVLDSEWQSYSDPLTGVGNRRLMEWFMDQFPDHPLKAVVFCDVDNLKALNDQYGHAQGDEAIIIVANALKEAWSSSGMGMVFRVGGDEFVVLLPGITPSEAKTKAESILDHIRQQKLSCGDAVTLTAGISSTQSGAAWHHLVGRADVMMLEAKKEHKGHVVG